MNLHSVGGAGVECVLLVDAALDEREMYAVALRAEGYDVCESGDGEEALHETRTATPDVIVADVVLPKIDGFVLLNALRADVATRDVPFIMLAGFDQPLSAITRARAAGATTVRIKPCLPATLVRDVGGVLQACRDLREKAMLVRLRARDAMARAAAALNRVVEVIARACPVCGTTLKPSGVVRLSVGHTYYRPCSNGCGWWYYDAPAALMRKLI
jgi:DNA-binding response OmpR family regulator